MNILQKDIGVKDIIFDFGPKKCREKGNELKGTCSKKWMIFMSVCMTLCNGYLPEE